MNTCADRILALLEDHGINHVFGIPGIHNVELYRTLGHYRIRHITPRHEQGAGFMAYGYAFATGQPAACFLITGPGLLNAATAIAEAYSESLPMLVIASGNRRGEIGTARGLLHEMQDQYQVERQISGASHVLMDPGNIDDAIDQAFCLFRTARPRPYCLQVPRDLLAMPVEPKPLRGPAHIHPPGPCPKAIRIAIEMLGNARKPIVIVGGGAWSAGAALRRVVEAARLPVVSTNAGKGILSEAHELSLGSALPFLSFQERFAESDVILAIGSELAETDLLYTGRQHHFDGALIRVDVDSAQLTKNAKPALGIISDAQLALEAMESEFKICDIKPNPVYRESWINSLRTNSRTGWSKEADKHRAVIDILMETLSDDVIICADSTQIAYTGSHYYQSRAPRTWLFPNGFGTLGSAVPAAIGARLGRSDREVLAIVGDGGFLYTVAELATAVELQLPLPILLWNNMGYGEIRDAMTEKGIHPVGVDLPAPDFCAIAMGFGCYAIHVRRMDEIGPAIRASFTRRAPTVIQIDSFDRMFV